MLDIVQLAVLNDNYIYLIHDPVSAQTAVIDPAITEPVLTTLEEKGWSLNYILNTHHHWDHIGANLELKKITQCKIIAANADRSRIPGVDLLLNHGDKIKLGNEVATVLETPGHTIGHIVYHFANSHALFCGDTLFSMGCGRLFEGTAKQMWQSLQLIKQLPKQTHIYCTHEYTQANGEFALTLEPNNPQLQQRIQQVKMLRSKQQSTIPSPLLQELQTNPFLRENSLEIQQSINMTNKTEIEIFSKIRQLKDTF
ncbi:MAG: hydroxyacylglutathione hydrolase [Methylococcales symbiont of Iophon sp. n. MRB-2018]|nr:MAG: hydroxyacylglutathione hydrolase [Methylococcales symbiont of Iophon sp. n. MRB-2018]KAF3979759.1 MAG: hydroxyacylglutathione hydrolase [Methylococcales symbiont of Iophon sp. n. MRB-2018]